MPHPSSVGGSYRIDTSNPVSDHPLNRGLVAWWMGLPNNSGGTKLFDLRNRNHGTLTNGPTWTTGPYGFKAIQFDNTNDYITTGTAVSGTVLDPRNYSGFTLSFVVKHAGNATGVHQIIGCEYYPPNSGYFARLNDSGGPTSMDFVVNTSSGEQKLTGTLPSNVWHRVDLVYSASEQTYYRDGVQIATRTPTGTINEPIGTFLIGYQQPEAGRYYDGLIQSAEFRSRAISSSESAALADQWRRGYPDTLRRIPSRVWSFASPPATGSYTLTMDAGSYGVTGQAVGLKASRKLASASGSYSLTGSAVGLKAGRKVAVVAGSYSLTGSAVALKASRQLAIASGSYTLTGQDTGLKAGRKIAVASGSYTLTGQDVALNYSGSAGSYTLAIESGSYSLTGSSVGLIAARVLGIGTGAYSLTGSAVGLNASRQLAVGSASYALNGFAVALKAARQIAALSGSYTLTGQDITFTYTPAAVDLLSGLGAYYRLDNDLTDSSGNGRDLSGSVTYTTGRLNQSLASGTASRADYGPINGDPFSINFWVRYGGEEEETAALFGTPDQTELILVTAQPGGFLISGWFDGVEIVSANVVASSGDWVFVALTWDGTTARLYVDGSLEDSGATDAGGWWSEPQAFSASLASSGPIDEAAIYTRALTAAEVSALYNSGLGYDPTNVGPVSRFTIAGTDRSRVTIPGTDRSRVTVAATLRN